LTWTTSRSILARGSRWDALDEELGRQDLALDLGGGRRKGAQ